MRRRVVVVTLVCVGAIAALGRASGQGTGGGVGNMSVTGRMPARNGVVTLKVTDYDTARQRVLDAALEQGAELLDSRGEANFQGKRHGWVRLRLGADRLPGLLADVHGVGKLYSERIGTVDHVSEYEELERRVGRLREHQQRLAGVLGSRRRMRGSDILYLQERLFRAGVDEEMLMQRRTDLERAARASTLVVELFEPEPRRTLELGNYYAGASLRARTALYRVLARGMTAGAYVVAFAPFWIPALIGALLVGRKLWRFKGTFNRIYRMKRMEEDL